MIYAQRHYFSSISAHWVVDNFSRRGEEFGGHRVKESLAEFLAVRWLPHLRLTNPGDAGPDPGGPGKQIMCP